jgi:hypothetical protein
MIDAIEAWATKNDTSRSDAIRRLIETGLSEPLDSPRRKR